MFCKFHPQKKTTARKQVSGGCFCVMQNKLDLFSAMRFAVAVMRMVAFATRAVLKTAYSAQRLREKLVQREFHFLEEFARVVFVGLCQIKTKKILNFYC